MAFTSLDKGSPTKDKAHQYKLRQDPYVVRLMCMHGWPTHAHTFAEACAIRPMHDTTAAMCSQSSAVVVSETLSCFAPSFVVCY